tara:strand:- start:7692 stop:7856 length:165 start_codon:yes stop_codon:yes gene_type:complete
MPDYAGKKFSYNKEGMAALAKAKAKDQKNQQVAQAKSTTIKNPMNPMSSPPQAA